MPKFHIELTEQIPFPRDRVFARLADHNRLGSLVGLPIKRIRDSDQADPNGTGSVRWIGIGPVGFEETILTFEPDHLIEYSVTSLSAFRNHRARVRLSELPGVGTRLHYTVEFDETVPFSGRSLELATIRVIRRGIRNLNKALSTPDA